MDELNLTNCMTFTWRSLRILVIKITSESFDIATSRFSGTFTYSLGMDCALRKEGGYVIALKGAIYEEEVGESNKAPFSID